MAAKVRSKSVIVSYGACGETYLLIVFHKDESPESATQRCISYEASSYFRNITMQDYLPNVFESYIANVDVDYKRIELALWDTARQEESEHLLHLFYPNSHVTP